MGRNLSRLFACRFVVVFDLAVNCQEQNWTDSVTNHNNEHPTSWGNINALVAMRLISGCHSLANYVAN